MVAVRAEPRRATVTRLRGRTPESTVKVSAGVVVAAGPAVVRIGLASAIGRLGMLSGIEFAGEAADGEQLRAQVARGASRVVVLDPGLPDDSDVGEVVPWLLARRQRVLVFATAGQEAQIRQAVRAGAQGVSLLSEPVSETLARMRAVAAGEDVVPQRYLTPADDEAESSVTLSLREREVLALYVDGCDIATIARRLYLGENSVKEYLRRLRGKYNAAGRRASTKVDLLRRAIEDGVVPPIHPR